MMQQLVAFAVLVPAFVGHGLLWSRLFHWATARRWTVPTDDPGLLGVAGCVGVMTLAAVASFAVPISPGFAAALAAAGWLTLALHARSAFRALNPARVAILGVSAAAVGATMLGAPHFQAADTGLYHWPTVKWAIEQPVTPGLANLHFRFGFNSSWYLLGATAHLPGLGPRGVFALNGVFLFFGVAALFWELHRGLRRGRVGPSAVFAATLLLLFALRFQSLLYSQVGAIGNDGAIAFSHYLAVLLLVAWLESGGRRPDCLPSLLAVCLFGALAKLTGSALGVGAAAVVGWSLWRRGGGAALAPVASGAAIVAAAVLIPWLLRGYAASGCLAFPAPSSCVLRPDWGVAPERAAELAHAHRVYALYGPGHRDVVHWPLPDRLELWADRLLDNRTIAAGAWLGAVGAALLAASLALGGGAARAARPVGGALVFAAFCALLWLVGTPGRRFGLGQVLSLGALLFAVGAVRCVPALAGWMARARGARRVAPSARWRWVVPLLLCAAIGRLGVDLLARRAESPTWRAALFRDETFPSVPYATVTAPSGASVHYARRPDRMCWDTPLPCARNAEVARGVRVGALLGRDVYRLASPRDGRKSDGT